LLEWKSTEELVFLLDGLESTMTHLGSGINESQINLLKGSSGLSGKERFSQDENSLLATDTTTFDHKELLIDDTVMWETTHWGDVLVSEIVLGGTVVLATSRGGLTDSVDLLVDFSSVMVTELTRSGDGVQNVGWMPGTDATDSSETSMSLSWESGDTESLDDTGITFTSGDTNDVAHFVLGENLVDENILLEFGLDEFDFLLGGTSVDLDLHEVSSFLS